MRKILIMFAFAAIVAGCNSNAKENAKINQDSIRIAKEKAKLDSFEMAEAAEKAAIVALANEKAAARIQSSQNISPRRTNTSSRRSNYSSGSSTTPQAPQKKGWSSAAKGAVIGGVVGAGTGVIIDKKDGRGAVIGGVVGAGTGYVIGRSRDKKSGRAQ
jgi:outer membrane murein-binding lipoprotein Lpp